MAKRIILGGVFGGLILFLWGYVSHAVLQLGDAGIKVLPNEDATVAALKPNITEPGFYFFPGVDHNAVHKMPKEQQEKTLKEWQAKYETGPRGILIYHPTGEQAMSPAQLGRQFGTDVVAMLIVSFLLTQLHERTRYTCRLLFTTTLGFLSAWTIGVPYWNWYGFPGVFTGAQLADRTIGFALAGLLLAKLIKPAPLADAAPATAGGSSTGGTSYTSP